MRARLQVSGLVVGLIAGVIPLVIFAVFGAFRLHGLDWKRNDAVIVLAPVPGASIAHPPIKVAWQAPAGLIGPGRPADRFAVFVDTTPVRPGQRVMSVLDRYCADQGTDCETEANLASDGIYLTTRPQLEIPTLPLVNSAVKNEHQVTIVLLDKDDRRLGEAAWTTWFTTTTGVEQ